MKKKEQHFTFDEKFTAIEQHYNGVDQLYAIFEFIIDLYSEIKSQNKFVSFYVTSKEFKRIEESGWLPENDDETEIWEETIKHISLADQYEALLKRLYYSLDKTNHELIELDNGRKSIVEKIELRYNNVENFEKSPSPPLNKKSHMKNFLSSSKTKSHMCNLSFRAKAERLHVFRAVLEQKIKNT